MGTKAKKKENLHMQGWIKKKATTNDVKDYNTGCPVTVWKNAPAVVK